jgi:hypothetical protein
MAATLGFSMALAVSSGIEGRAQEVVSERELPENGEKIHGPSRPMSAQVARTWIALHESKIRPLPDGTPLRQVLRELREATRGKSGWAEGVRFRVVSEALGEAETTLDAPVTLPFVGRPEVPVDMYLKYLLHEFVWERYVGAGAVVIDSPCDDCVGYETVSAAEAHTWLLLHQTIPLGLPQRASLGDFFSAITRETRGNGQDGRGLVVYPRPGALRVQKISLSTPIAIDARRTELGDHMRESLKPFGLYPRVLTDGTVMLTELDDGEGGDIPKHGAFPEWRFSYSFVWNQWVEALKEAAEAQRELEQAKKAARP